jgi:hypothetical protein
VFSLMSLGPIRYAGSEPSAMRRRIDFVLTPSLLAAMLTLTHSGSSRFGASRNEVGAFITNSPTSVLQNSVWLPVRDRTPLTAGGAAIAWAMAPLCECSPYQDCVASRSLSQAPREIWW